MLCNNLVPYPAFLLNFNRVYYQLSASSNMATIQSNDHRHLLDIIDKLRSQGCSRYIDLPEIIVCGDQSAGKSSVLEAISGMSFPTKDNLCTRFPTELVLRRDGAITTKVSITPGPNRSAEERRRLHSFGVVMHPDDPSALGDIVEKAKEVIQLSDHREFSTDTLRIELSGPDQPHLTMVDLPGLFRAGNRDQSVDNARTVRRMVKNYMKGPRSIILAVVSAKSDAALQEVTELAREVDPTGDRTLGLITKPDCLDAGSDMERSYLSLAENKNVEFRLGWHVLKNRNYEMRNATLAERNEAEDEFFSKGNWASVDRSCVGIAALKPRLSNVLKDQILRQLPSLFEEVESGILDCQRRLERLGTPRTTVSEQRRYLHQVSQRFTTLVKAAVDGVYNEGFFGSAKTDEGYQKRLRAVVQNTLSDFEESMRVRGRSRAIVESEPAEGEELGAGRVSREEYLDEVRATMRRNRGCELPGTFNPLIVGELFTEQCRPWRDITASMTESITECMYRTTRAIVDHIVVPDVADEVLGDINTGIEKLKIECDDKTAELLKPHNVGHPITYNHYLTDQVQKVQSERRKKTVQSIMMEHYGEECFTAAEFYTSTSINGRLLDAIVQSHEADMEIHAASLAVDYMQAYYKASPQGPVDSGPHADRVIGFTQDVRRRNRCSRGRAVPPPKAALLVQPGRRTRDGR